MIRRLWRQLLRPKPSEPKPIAVARSAVRSHALRAVAIHHAMTHQEYEVFCWGIDSIATSTSVPEYRLAGAASYFLREDEDMHQLLSRVENWAMQQAATHITHSCDHVT